MMMMDLEEGEVQSSDEDDPRPPRAPANSMEEPEFPDDADYVILERPKSSLPAPSSSISTSSPLALPVASTALGNNSLTAFGNSGPGQPQQCAPNPPLAPFQSQASSSFAEFSVDECYGRKAYYKNLGVSDLLDSQSSDDGQSSDSDSGSDFNDQFGKRSRMGLPSMSNPNNNATSTSAVTSYPGLFSSDANVKASSSMASSSSSMSALSAFQAEASKFQSQRKPNTIWSSVMQEEQISNFFEGVKVEEPGQTYIEIERGPETYTFQLPPMREPRQRRPSDSSDISSEGLSDNALHYLRDGTSYNEDEETGESSEYSLPKSFTSRTVSRKATATKRRRTHPKLKRKVLNKLKKMKAPDLAQYMATKLSESKVHLLERSVEILGKENCIHIFIKTLKIQKRGGLMVKNQQRRRTAGGVFLYLIRGDRRFPKSQIDLIFRDERTFHDKVRKKKTAVGRLRKKAQVEAELELGNMNK